MGLGNVVNEFLNQHGLADTGTTEQTNLSTTSVRGEQVDDFNAGLQDFSSGGLLDEGWRVGVDRAELDALDRTPLINGLANDVHDTAQSTLSDRDSNGGTSVDDLLSTDETLGTVHCDGSDRVLAKVSGDLENEPTTVEVLDFKSVEDGWQVLGLELHIYDGTNDRLDMADCSGSFRSVRPCC